MQAILKFSELDPVDQRCRNGTMKQMLKNNFISDATGTRKLTLWDQQVGFVKQKLNESINCFKFKNIRVKTFMGQLSLSSIPKSEILPTEKCPTLLENVVPPDDPTSNQSEVMQAEKILLVSNYQEYASCLNCKKKITELNTVKEIKCGACGTSQRPEDCDIKVNIRIKLESHGEWLTIFENQWQQFGQV